MRFRRLVKAFPFVVLAAVAPRADAQACAGFADVSINSGFCNQVSWLKNRQVTLGCDATHYCPFDSVNRLSMAAFMNRVGNVMTPQVLSVEETGGTLDPGQENIVCKTGIVPARDYRRFDTAEASLSFEVTAPQYLAVAIVRSTDGTNWQTGGQGVVYPQVDGGARHHVNTLRSPATLSGSPTLAYHYGILVQRYLPPAVVNAISSWTCHLQVTVSNGVENAGI